MHNPHPLRCRCGKLQGILTAPEQAVRLTCYCRDCQTAANVLNDAGRTLDSQGGTTILASVQSNVSFMQGHDELACLSLTDRGIYRWYARCCRTPIANTVRRPQMSYVGIVHTCLGESALETAQAWPGTFNVYTAHAKGLVPRPGLAAVGGVLTIARHVLTARLLGRWRRSPFFAASEQPVSPAKTLTPAELRRGREAASPDRTGS